jgi:hypothetical protein
VPLPDRSCCCCHGVSVWLAYSVGVLPASELGRALPLFRTGVYAGPPASTDAGVAWGPQDAVAPVAHDLYTTYSALGAQPAAPQLVRFCRRGPLGFGAPRS